MKSLYSNALLSCWAQGIHTSTSTSDDIKSYLRGNKSFVYSYSDSRNLSMYSSHLTHVVPYFASEAVRFAAASIETMMNSKLAQPINNRSQGWKIIQLYYAAFYAAHSLIRTFGRAITMIDASVATAIEKKLTSFGNPLAKMQSGEYKILLEEKFFRLDLAHIGDIGKGTHERLWWAFSDIIQLIKSKLTTSGITAIDVVNINQQLDELDSVLKTKNHSLSSWLSTVRNDVTYKNSHGVWYPYVNPVGDPLDIDRYCDLWRQLPENITLSSRNDLDRFIFACHFIISICHTNMINLNRLSERKNNVFRNKYMNMINLHAPSAVQPI